MWKSSFLFLVIVISASCALVSPKKEESSEKVKHIAFENFIPEENQEVLEMIRGDILISRLLRDSTLIAEEILVNPDRNILGGVSPGSPHYAEYMNEVNQVRHRIVVYISENQPKVIETVKAGTFEESEIRENNLFNDLILKYAQRAKLELPMLSQMNLLSQGSDYYAYRYKVINYPEYDFASFSTYNPWYSVKFVFKDGVLSEYQHF
jgi:hypothetical protein